MKPVLNTTETESMVVAPAPESIPTAAAENTANAVVGFGPYFGLSALFSIPVIGWIASVLFSFIPKRKSLKNYARAMLVWTSIGLVITVLVVSLLLSVGNLVVQELNNQLGTEFGGITDMINVVNNLKNGKYSAVIARLGNMLPEEYQPLVEELSTGRYDELIGLVAKGDYAGAVESLQSDVGVALKNKVGEDAYNVLIDELEKAADTGEKAQWIETVQKFASGDVMSIVTEMIS